MLFPIHLYNRIENYHDMKIINDTNTIEVSNSCLHCALCQENKRMFGQMPKVPHDALNKYNIEELHYSFYPLSSLMIHQNT